MHLQYGDFIYHRLNALSVRNTGGAMIEATLSSWFWFNPSIFGSWVALGSTGGGHSALKHHRPFSVGRRSLYFEFSIAYAALAAPEKNFLLPTNHLGHFLW